jgi:predicted nuclease with RNAse H fold
MLTVGVDLAAAASNTAVAWILWSKDWASVQRIAQPADDKLIIEAVVQADLAGIDCPFGWPEPFVEFVSQHRDGRVVTPEGVAGPDWRRRLAYRATDLMVQATVGRWPLSVSTDRIGYPAMRCASLLARLAERGQEVDRAGGGSVVEVYPAASLRKWGFTPRSYKGRGNGERLWLLVGALQDAAPWLDLGPHEEDCRRSHDATDAVVAALTARATALGLTPGPGPEHAEVAATEGWIMVPEEGSLARLPVGEGRAHDD